VALAVPFSTSGSIFIKKKKSQGKPTLAKESLGVSLPTQKLGITALSVPE
jgi:hypothetical protein